MRPCDDAYELAVVASASRLGRRRVWVSGTEEEVLVMMGGREAGLKRRRIVMRRTSIVRLQLTWATNLI